MTEHKFTDEEIIKALECCAVDPQSGKFSDCKNCPLDAIGDANCFTFMIQQYALDLIKRQKAEIEKLTVDLVGMRGAANSYKMHYDRVKDLNAALEADLVNANMNLNHITYEFDLLKQEKSVVVAEAVKEFADRLKKYYASLGGKTAAGCVEYHVDQIAKEMIGETK